MGAASVFVLALLATACSAERPTELIVVVDSDIPAIDRVKLSIESEGRPVVDDDRMLDEENPLPRTVGLRPRAPFEQLVVVEAIGYADGVALVTARARTRVAAGERRVLRVMLEAACVSRPCPELETCRGGVCTDAYVDWSTLPPYQGALPDGGPPIVPVDGGAGDGGPRDAAMDAASCVGDAGTTGMPEGCVLERWPARPTCADDAVELPARHIALLDPMFDQSGDRWRTTGFDLDGLCTDPPVDEAPTECRTPVGATVSDGVGGTDNAAGNVLSAGVIAIFPQYESDAHDALTEGRAVPIIELAGWNGEPDDPRVSVWFAGSVDVVRSEDEVPVESFDPAASREDPRLDGTDRAYVATAYFDPVRSEPLVRDDNAYIAGRVLVMRVPDRAPLDFPLSGREGVARLRLSDTRFVAWLSEDGTRFERSVLVGRWSRADMFAYIGDLGICESNPELEMYVAIFGALLDRSLDIRGVPGSGGVGVDCDAVSTAIPFERSVPVELVGIVPLEFAPGGCP